MIQEAALEETVFTFDLDDVITGEFARQRWVDQHVAVEHVTIAAAVIDVTSIVGEQVKEGLADNGCTKQLGCRAVSEAYPKRERGQSDKTGATRIRSVN